MHVAAMPAKPYFGAVLSRSKNHVYLTKAPKNWSGDWIVRRLGKLRALTKADSRSFESFRRFAES